MRLCVLAFYYPPDLCACSFRTKALVDALRERTDDPVHVDVITTQPNRYESFTPDASDHETSNRVNVYRARLPQHKSGMIDQALSYFWYTRFVLRQTRGKRYDVVFATSSRLFTAGLGALISKIRRALLYLDLRDIFVENMDEMLSGPARLGLLPFFRLVERFALRQASALNCVSPGFKPYFAAKTHLPMTFLTNGIDPEFLETDFSKPAASPRPVVTYAGNIGEGQGLHQLFPAVARAYPQLDFQIIGSGGKRAALEAQVAELENVTLIPPVSRPELIDIYRNSDFLLLHLNDYKAFERVLPSKIFEYGATGKPIIAGVGGYARQFIEGELPDAFCFDPCNVEQLRAVFDGTVPGPRNRKDFRARHNRANIMRIMVEDLLMLSRS